MKKNVFYLTACLLGLLLMISCSDDETFYTGEEAKSAIKHEWNVSSIEIQSNDAGSDKLLNYLFKTVLLNTHTFTKTYADGMVTTYFEPKDTTSLNPMRFVDGYIISNDSLIVTNSILAHLDMPIAVFPNTYKLSDKNLDITSQTLNKARLLFLSMSLDNFIIKDPTLSSVLYQATEAIPDDYSAQIILHLRR